ncbi:MAG TPA: hypothetical protein VHP11_05710 [Tepidisphaeraceae bacterium]|nr:hypothetical protein [Tepidisphaeraceae bacterium]
MSATFNAIVHKAALDTLAAQRWTRHLLIDSEQDGKPPFSVCCAGALVLLRPMTTTPST